MTIFCMEGMDGSGKSTIARRLKAALGDIARLGPEPTYSNPVGRFIRQAIEDHDPVVSGPAGPFLFSADRVLHQQEISSWVASGGVYVLDRYYHSTLVYQYLMKLLRHGEPGSPEWVLARESMFWLPRMVADTSKACTPDVTYFFIVNPEEAARRIQDRNGMTISEFEQVPKLADQRRCYLYLSGLLNPENVVLVNADMPPEDVWRQVVTSLPDLPPGCPTKADLLASGAR